MQQLLLMIHVIIAVAIIVLVLLQQGKGAEMGAAFGSGASQTLFGSRGSGSFLLKMTALLALLFFLTNLSLGYIASKQAKQDPLQALSKISKTITTVPVAPANQQNGAVNLAVPPPAETLPMGNTVPTNNHRSTDNSL